MATIGDIFVDLFGDREAAFQRYIKDLKKSVPKKSGTRLILDMLSKSKNDENRAGLMEVLFNRIYNQLMVGAGQKDQRGLDPFIIDPGKALLGDMTTDLSKMFNPGVREFVAPEKVEEDFDPRATDSRDNMRLPKSGMRKRYFDMLEQREKRGL